MAYARTRLRSAKRWGSQMFLRMLLAALLLAASALAASADQPLSPDEQVAAMKRGVNIVGYDPLWQDASKARFQPRHFKIIKDGGFDTVRINLYGLRHMNEKLLV